MSSSPVALAAGDTELMVSPHGGRWLSLTSAGHALLVPSEGLELTRGCFVMAPWAGRLGGGHFEWGGRSAQLPLTDGTHALHGTVLDRRWTVTSSTTSSVELICDLGPRWPWPGWCRQSIELDSRSLRARIEVGAEADPFPAACGWHPWFARWLDGCEVSWSHSSAAMLVRGEDHLPTGARTAAPPVGLDDYLVGVDWPVELEWGDRARVEVRADTDGAVLYDGLDHGVCVEPQSAPPDAHNRFELPLVEPGRPLVATMAWSWGVDAV